MAFQDFCPNKLHAAVVRPETISMCIVKCDAQNLIVEGIDIFKAHTYRNIDQDIYMEQLCDSTGEFPRPGHVCKLEKSLHGLEKLMKYRKILSRIRSLNEAFIIPLKIKDYICSAKILFLSLSYLQ